MRIITGSAKGRRLISPKGRGVRPTSDMVKEALFNIISAKVMGSNFLDLFAGSGAVGIEALSRGARSATFIESDPSAVMLIKRNLEAAGFSDRASVIATEVLSSFQKGLLKGSRFELIFLDPPYKIDLDVLNSIFIGFLNEQLLLDDSLIILEHSSRIEPDFLSLGFQRVSIKKYGDQALSLYKPLKDRQKG